MNIDLNIGSNTASNTEKGDKTVLVTGATGFLGGTVCKRLVREGYNVIATGRDRQKGLQLGRSGIAFSPADIRNKNALAIIFKKTGGIDIIVHCAALSSPWGKYSDFYETNVSGTENIVDLALTFQVKKIIHISTTSIYFEFKNKINLKEDAPLPPKFITPYAKTKHLAEKVVIQAAGKGLESVILRPSGIFGPGDTAILPRLVKANNKFFIPVFKERNARIDITYVDNVAQAVSNAIFARDIPSGACYNITNDEPVDLHKLVKVLIIRLGYPFRQVGLPYRLTLLLSGFLEFIYKYLLMNREPPLTRYTVGLLTQVKTLDITKAKAELNFHPEISVAQGLDRVVQHWKTNGC